MKVKVHCRNFDREFKLALYSMVEFAMARLVTSSRLRKNLTIDVHLMRHSAEGEAMLAETANPYRPREFKVIINHHALEIDHYGRTRDMTEWAHEVLKTLAHELVHVKQYVLGELAMRKDGLYSRGIKYDVETLSEYFELPYEIEAYGREKGLLVSFLEFWKQIEEEGLLDIS